MFTQKSLVFTGAYFQVCIGLQPRSIKVKWLINYKLFNLLPALIYLQSDPNRAAHAALCQMAICCCIMQGQGGSQRSPWARATLVPLPCIEPLPAKWGYSDLDQLKCWHRSE